MSDDRRLIVFRSRLLPGVDLEQYGARAEAMLELARTMPGFVSSRDYAADDGERLALIEFESREHLAAWRDHPEHRLVQREGQVRWYREYKLSICRVVRESRFDVDHGRSQFPEPKTRERVELAGGCACGAIRYRVRGTPFNETLCHCSDCRKACGATPVAWATFEESALSFESGSLRERASSERARRGFCADCGAQVTFRDQRFPAFIDLAIGTLDEPGRIAPRDHTWVRSKPNWVAIGDDLPCFERERPTE
jgi:heme-degrading monooxygenase HmoA